MTRFYVISTSDGSPEKGRCIASVASQVGVNVFHRYIDASTQECKLSAMQNFLIAMCNVPDPDDVIACVDGDDWLLHESALAIVAKIYDEKPETWVTYGQFRSYALGVECTPYPRDEYRSEPWRASHLKTFRAGLFHKIKRDDLRVGGEFTRYCCDLAVMFPLLEMAGPERTVFNPEPIYFYNNAHRFEFAEREGVAAWEVEKHFRSLPRYERVLAL
jgi:hypothetical protein